MKTYVNVKDRIYLNLISDGVRHPYVFKAYSAGTKEIGWHYCEFGTSEDIYLGASYKDYCERRFEIIEAAKGETK